jgi:hypothetical protein
VTGVKYTLGATATNVCNGKEGPQGPAGKDGETGFTETLPSEKTETGTFTASRAAGIEIAPGVVVDYVNASFNIPLAANPGVNVIKNDGTTPLAGSKANCPGSYETPDAVSGQLCLYGGPIEFNVEGIAGGLQGTAGVHVLFKLGNPGYAIGSWAVTG